MSRAKIVGKYTEYLSSMPKVSRMHAQFGLLNRNT
jgi:hypothetical protein